MSHLHGPAATKIRVLENEIKMLKSEIERIQKEKTKEQEEEERIKYIAYTNIPVLGTRVQGITCDIQFSGETLIECSNSNNKDSNEIKLYLEYHEKDKNMPINNLSIFKDIRLFYGENLIAQRNYYLGNVEKGYKDYYLLSDIFPGLKFNINNRLNKKLVLRFNISHKYDYRITKFECRYLYKDMNDGCTIVWGFKDLISMSNSYYNDYDMYKSKIFMFDIRDSGEDYFKDFKYKVETPYDYYVNDKFMYHEDNKELDHLLTEVELIERKEKYKHDNDEGLHYYKFDDDKIYLLYVQQIYQIKTD